MMNRKSKYKVCLQIAIDLRDYVHAKDKDEAFLIFIKEAFDGLQENGFIDKELTKKEFMQNISKYKITKVVQPIK